MGGGDVLVYLFRDASGCNSFAYSTDVTGRNIPLASSRSDWKFVAAVAEPELEDSQTVRRGLRQKGFHLFQRTGKPFE
jgi:hypothetical protein